ncbi:MAG: hypothetical protein KDA85_22375 [Planctomycetaceae bacterium]|nr:hypothetical protein [Planctomycetaceae bacterium]
MKLIRLLPGSVALALAGSVCAGSVYVATNAAAAVDENAAVAEAEVVVTEQPTAKADESLMPEQIPHQHSSSIGLDAQGGFRGRLGTIRKTDNELVAIGKTTVKLLADGHVVASTVTAADGTFRFSGQTEGVKGLIAINDSGMLFTGVRLVHGDPPADYTHELAVNAAITAASDLDRARSLIMRNLPRGDERFVGSPTENDNGYPFGGNQASTSIQSHTVALQVDGSLEGEINLMDDRTGRYREIEDLTVYMLRDGVQVGQTRVNPNGTFSVRGLTPGVHSVVVAGRDGTVAMGVSLVSQEVALNPAAHGYQLTTVMQQLNLAASPVNAENLNQDNFDENVGGDNPPPAPPQPPVNPAGPVGGGPGGGGTGAGGGGAGGGGGGLLGPLLGAGIGAGIGAAIANDNNNGASPGN